MKNKHLNFGVYLATNEFKAIQEHSCVCFDNMTLVAVTGPANDKESQEYAELFAASPELLKFAKDILRYVESGAIATADDRAFVAAQARTVINLAEGN